jgi:hypothetical protein
MNLPEFWLANPQTWFHQAKAYEQLKVRLTARYTVKKKFRPQPGCN